MSHNVEFFDYPENIRKSSVQKNLDSYVAHADWQEGASGLGAQIRWLENVPVCEDYDAAKEYIQQHDRGDYDQLAVRYYADDPRVKLTSKKLEGLLARRSAELNKQASYDAAHSVKTFKAEYIGCSKCGSKLSRKFLRGEHCPLCRTDLRSKTTLDTLARYDANIRDLTKQITEETAHVRSRTKRDVRWLVKIEYHT